MLRGHGQSLPLVDSLTQTIAKARSQGLGENEVFDMVLQEIEETIPKRLGAIESGPSRIPQIFAESRKAVMEAMIAVSEAHLNLADSPGYEVAYRVGSQAVKQYLEDTRLGLDINLQGLRHDFPLFVKGQDWDWVVNFEPESPEPQEPVKVKESYFGRDVALTVKTIRKWLTPKKSSKKIQESTNRPHIRRKAMPIRTHKPSIRVLGMPVALAVLASVSFTVILIELFRLCSTD
jgi:hypothetical protein